MACAERLVYQSLERPLVCGAFGRSAFLSPPKGRSLRRKHLSSKRGFTGMAEGVARRWESLKGYFGALASPFPRDGLGGVRLRERGRQVSG